MNRSPSTMTLLSGLCLLATICCTGCQTTPAGNPLPSPNYLDGQVQYFPTGPKFKLEKEAAALKAYSEQQAQAAGSYVDQQVQAGNAYADQQLQAGRAYADQQIQQASSMIPSMNMPPIVQPAGNSVTISAD